MIDRDFKEANNKMVDYLIEVGTLRSNRIIEAFRNIDRADFVVDRNSIDVYGDYPLGIGNGQTISQPRTVAMMLEMLSPKEGERILDIGSGSGWTTALLAYIVGGSGSVVGVERVKELVEFGSSNLKRYKFKNAKIVEAGDELGIVGDIFDCILVSAAADELPYELIKQLRVGGKLVIPIQSSVFEIIKKEDGSFDANEHYGFAFVPLIY
ncbi:methyltransferase domain-containing protein [Sulfurimonas sp.]|jgi:protein-L-isoaspartate(D-aspartate) O-methyltransferase|uniref:protein-L-isoaspartate O-methyltransferase family protein n=1 Tax=Sulfurimonas sp. TaxID=2022749 RepID=UPI0025DD12AD|nr:methyltransferase domain-containing protein [Sulfurimonas sp.]MCK9473922.1 methyltransferase domain-containing protein [Sulfurimonas sp.]MDD3506364.1 methyltransferase domain-containing protein [Sulfurimonas sp.]